MFIVGTFLLYILTVPLKINNYRDQLLTELDHQGADHGLVLFIYFLNCETCSCLFGIETNKTIVTVTTQIYGILRSFTINLFSICLIQNTLHAFLCWVV